MRESFLHYIWQYQLFNKVDLSSTQEEKITIEKAGTYTQTSGPDFVNAKIQIGTQLWFGNVEIHLKSSDWYIHHHQTDNSYDNVILHVVWEDDVSIFRADNSPISTLELKGKVPQYLLENYTSLFDKKPKWIQCEDSIKTIDLFTWNNTLEKIFFERLNQKTETIELLLTETNNNWEAVLFILLAKNFGLKANGDVFFSLAKSLDYNIVVKLADDYKNLEALFYGILNMLDAKSEDVYENELIHKYSFIKHKYNLLELTEKVQYFRLHPPNFPNIRLSQFAQLISNNIRLFQKVIQSDNLESLYALFGITTSEYWKTHYTFNKNHPKINKKTTKSFIDLLVINTVIPVKFVYLKQSGNSFNESLIQIISQIKREENSIVNGFMKYDLPIGNAMQSQAILSLKKSYCDHSRCLECPIGLKILNQNN